MEYLSDHIIENTFEELIAKRERIVKDYIELAERIINNQEVFDFSGLDAEAYDKLKTDEDKWPEINGDIPDYILSVDDLMKEFAANGIKVVAADDRGAGNFFVVAAKKDSKVIAENSVSPWQLRIADGINEELKNLIIASQELHDITLVIKEKRA